MRVIYKVYNEKTRKYDEVKSLTEGQRGVKLFWSEQFKAYVTCPGASHVKMVNGVEVVVED